MAFFDYIVSLSIRSAVVIPVAVLVRTLLKKYPKRYSYFVWIIVFVCLVVKIDLPAKIETPAVQAQQTMQQQYENMMNSYTGDINIYHDNTEEYHQAVQQGIQPVISEEGRYVITEKDTYAPPATVKSSFMPKVQFVWLAGIAVLLIVYIKNIIGITSVLKFAVPYKYDIYYSEYITSPFVFGIIKPKIYLPCSITKEQAEAVVSHERVHIKRLDYIVKPLCFFITVLHWFNPLAWIAFYLMAKDMEQSCDEAVVKYYDSNGKKEYCNALMQFAIKDEQYKIGTVMFGESDCSNRIKNILSDKYGYKLIAEILVLVVLSTAIGCTAENSIADESKFYNMTYAQLEEYQPQSDEEKIQIARAMDKIPDSEIAAFLIKEIADYCEKDSFAKLKTVSVCQDHTQLVYNDSKKALCNADVKIELELYPYNNVDIKTQAREYCRNLYNYLYGETVNGVFVPNVDFVTHKTKSFQIYVYSEKDELISVFGTSENNPFENPSLTEKTTVWVQSLTQIEQNALDKAFVYGDKIFVLKNFGIKNVNELYIEYHIEDDYFHKGEGSIEDKISAQTAALNDKYADITEKVINHNDIQQYIEQNNLQTAVVAFSHRYLENGKVEFEVILNKDAPQFTHDFETEDSLQAEIEYITVETNYFKNAVFIGGSIADGLKVYENIDNSISDIAQFETYKNMTPDIFMNKTDDLSNKTSFEKVVEQSPKQIYILMGTDALVSESKSRFIADYSIMVKQLKEKLPDTVIYVCGIPPVSEEQSEKRPNFNKFSLESVNRELRILATTDGVYYLDIYEILADIHGYLKADFAFSDGIHIVPEAYRQLINYFRSHVVAENYSTRCIYDVTKDFAVIWPTEKTGVRVNRGFSGEYPAHDGLDIAGAQGTEIYAAADGTVNISAETTDRYGNYIVILHNDGYRTLYAHCDTLLVKTGENVKQGQLIATMGSTGNSTGNHLHFGISKDFEYINTEEFLNSYPIDADCENCGGQMVVYNESFGGWMSAGQDYCVHGHVFGTDLIMERGYIKTTVCSECNFGDAELITETKLECCGR